MLDIDKNSWHYRFAFNSPMPRLFTELDIEGLEPYAYCKNLCQHMRQVFKAGLFNFLGLLGVFGVFHNLYMHFVYGVINNWPDRPDLGITLTVLGVVSIILGYIILFAIACIAVVAIMGAIIESDWHKARRAKQKAAEPVVKGPNIFVEWVRAKHNKVCPLIEYKEQ